MSISGLYECTDCVGTPNQNDWHFVVISEQADGSLNWCNRAGVSWMLLPDGVDQFVPDPGAPYQEQGYSLVRGAGGQVTGILKGGEAHGRVGDLQPPQVSKCPSCKGLGAFDCWDKCCTRGSMHAKAPCQLCDGTGQVASNVDWAMCGQCAGMGGHKMHNGMGLGKPARNTNMHFSKACTCCAGNGWTQVAQLTARERQIELERQSQQQVREAEHMRQRQQRAHENELERLRQNELAGLQFDKRRLAARQEEARQKELLRNQISAVGDANRRALERIESTKLFGVPVERHKIEESSDHGCLGDAVKSLNQIPVTVREQDFARLQLCDDFDNCCLYYPTDTDDYYEIEHRRKRKWTLSHTCKAIVHLVRFQPPVATNNSTPTSNAPPPEYNTVGNASVNPTTNRQDGHGWTMI